jgi:peptidoglycan biosynthesis protein MviN/MurJ (putative lipid II flippase)
MLLSKVAALAALGVALFPCGCGTHEEIVPYVHYISAAAMFIVLACLCGIFFKRARLKGHREAKWRSYIYAVCGITIVIVIAVLAIDHFAGDPISSRIPRLTFYGERAGLVAFGISWLVASRALPFITAPRERVSVLPISAS